MSRTKKNSTRKPPKTTDESESVGVAAPLTADRALWWEVLAVLSVGVLPYLGNALIRVLHPPGPNSPNPLPYWLDALSYSFQNACVSFVVLYLIQRSGESWATFGIKRLRFVDFILGLLLFLVPLFLWRVQNLFPTADIGRRGSFQPLSQVATDYVLMTIMFTVVSFSKELVVRAYLITRLERLFRSQAAAVVTSSVLFASYHIDLGSRALSPMIGGLVFGAVYLAVRRIWPFVLAHTLYDIFCALAR